MTADPKVLGEIAYYAWKKAAIDFGLGPIGAHVEITPWADLDAVTRAAWNASSAAVAAELAPRQGSIALQAITQAQLAVKNMTGNHEREIELALIQLDSAWQWVRKALAKPRSSIPPKKDPDSVATEPPPPPADDNEDRETPVDRPPKNKP